MFSCSYEKVEPVKDDGITTLWSAADSGSRTVDSNSPEAHAVAIQGIKPKHPIAKDFLAELRKHGYKESDLDLTNITRTILTKSSAVALSVPSKKAEGEMIMAYLYKKTYCVIRGVRDGNITNYSTIDDAPFASFAHDDNATTVISKTANENLEEFSTLLYADKSEGGSGMTTRAGGCCRQAGGWNDCMSCTHGAMGAVGYIMAARIWQFEVAVAASCIGAGSGAWC